MVLEVGKLLRTFPCVLEPKVIKPARAIVRQARRDTPVLMWVTRENLSRVGVFKDP